MGTNFPSFLQEAHRVLKPSCWLLIAEVKSRFNPNNGGADPDRFSQAVCDLGFTSVSKAKNNSSKEIKWPELKPCYTSVAERVHTLYSLIKLSCMCILAALGA
ncbi:hypothetical protein L1987_84228 [Smallanthus sonchifolius]|uniref:Uncharacterized protein n=1 Tax=Smallanthus sonchifolius TaxID=185202 RepID=A0ACB8YE55_9ASTR|nr:hypothetical protein L1987_84228 [Smallanthus sonchifolius]